MEVKVSVTIDGKLYGTTHTVSDPAMTSATQKEVVQDILNNLVSKMEQEKAFG